MSNFGLDYPAMFWQVPEVQTAFTAEASVRLRKTPQSTHPESVAAALKEVFAWLGRLC